MKRSRKKLPEAARLANSLRMRGFYTMPKGGIRY